LCFGVGKVKPTSTYFIVSHGDPLQILTTSASGRDLRLHQQLDLLKMVELRALCETR